MKIFKLLILALIYFCSCSKSTKGPIVENSDIKRFWNAYDQIRLTSDSTEQSHILKKVFIKPGTDGLKAIMDKKGYTVGSYIHAIRQYPKFWDSVRENTLTSEKYADDIEQNVTQLKSLYPDLKPAQVFFTIGVLRTGGTAHKGHVLIGSELAMADSTTVTHEIEPQGLRENLHKHFSCNPIKDIVLLNVHEYVHTQQGDYGTDLLSMCIYEGAAEFVSTLAANKPSAAPAIPFGKENDSKIKERFQTEMFSPHWNDWLYNDRANEFGVRDLGYYIGYAICEKYYLQASDKTKAIKEIIELDCSNKKDVKNFLLKSNYLIKSYEELFKEYNENIPVVTGVKELPNKNSRISADQKTITIQFSQAMNKRFRNFKFGSKGQKHVLPINDVEWNNDATSVIFHVDLKSNQHYQIVMSNEFRDVAGRPLESYLIDFKTNK